MTARRLGVVIAAGLLCGARAEAERVVVAARGCPSPEGVARALGPLLPGAEIVLAAPGDDATLMVRVTDRGDTIFLEAPTASAELLDTARDCEERARSAAVWLALRLRPPSVTLPEIAPPRAPPIAAGPARPAPSPLLRVDLEAAGLADLGPRSGGSTLVTGGGALRLVLGLSWAALAIGGGGEAPVSFELPPGTVRLLRFPFDASLRAALVRGRFEGELELGAQVAWLSVVGSGYPTSHAAELVEVGARAAARLRWRVAPRVALFVAPAVTLVPAPHRLLVSPDAGAAATPSVWLSVEAGLAVRIH